MFSIEFFSSIPLAHRLWAGFTLLAAMFITLYPVFDYDLYWHLAYGREIVERGELLMEDVFSYTAAGKTFTNRYWLAQALLFLIWNSLGGSGLLLFKLLITALVAMLMFLTARLLNASPAMASLTTILAALTGFYRFTERPELFSLLFFAFLAFVLTGYQQQKLDSRWLYTLPALMLSWDWLHGGIYGLAMLTVFVMTTNFSPWDAKRPTGEVRRLNLVALIILIVMAINPTGLISYDEFIGHVIEPMTGTTNIEYQPASWREFKPFYLMLGWSIAATIIRPRPQLAAQAMVILALGLMTWQISRVVGIFAIACAPYLAVMLTITQNDRPWTTPLIKGSLIVASIWLVFYTLWVKLGPDSPQHIGWSVDDQFLPAGTVRFIKEIGLTGNLYNSGEIGGYLCFSLFPFDRVFQYNHGAMFGNTSRYINNPAELEPWHITHAIISQPQELIRLFPPHSWARIYRDPGAALVIRRTPQNQGLISHYELKYFHPMLENATFLKLATNNKVRHRLAFEIATYLSFRKDPRIARLLAELEESYKDLGNNEELQASRQLRQRYNPGSGS